MSGKMSYFLGDSIGGTSSARVTAFADGIRARMISNQPTVFVNLRKPITADLLEISTFNEKSESYETLIRLEKFNLGIIIFNQIKDLLNLSLTPSWLGANHVGEIRYIFQGFNFYDGFLIDFENQSYDLELFGFKILIENLTLNLDIFGITGDDQDLGYLMQDLWYNFAKTGTPSGIYGNPSQRNPTIWEIPEYHESEGSYMALSVSEFSGRNPNPIKTDSNAIERRFVWDKFINPYLKRREYREKEPEKQPPAKKISTRPIKTDFTSVDVECNDPKYPYSINGGCLGPIIYQATNGAEVEEIRGVQFGTAGRFENSGLPENLKGTHILAKNYGKMCPYGTTSLIDRDKMSEDCLYMNIYKNKNLDPKKTYPVYFHIHGGGFEYGDGSQLSRQPVEMVARHDVIGVSINYRLNVFGFLKDMVNDPPTFSNLGLRDQLFALEFINQNIHKFGGDPTRVTLAGESAGSKSIDILAVSHYVKNYAEDHDIELFDRIIMQGGTLNNYTMDDGLAINQGVFNLTDCDLFDYDCLKKLSMEELRDVSLKLPSGFLPTLGDDILPDTVSNLRSQDNQFYHNLDVLLGYSSGEGSLGRSRCDTPKDQILSFEDSFQRFQEQMIGDYQTIQMAANPEDYYLPTEEEMRITFIKYYPFEDYNQIRDSISNIDNEKGNFCAEYGDFRIVAPTNAVANYLADFGNSNVFLYEFDYVKSADEYTYLKATHASEMIFVSGCILRQNCNNIKANQQDRDMAETVMQVWFNFMNASSEEMDSKTFTLADNWYKYKYNNCLNDDLSGRNAQHTENQCQTLGRFGMESSQVQMEYYRRADFNNFWNVYMPKLKRFELLVFTEDLVVQPEASLKQVDIDGVTFYSQDVVYNANCLGYENIPYGKIQGRWTMPELQLVSQDSTADLTLNIYLPEKTTANTKNLQVFVDFNQEYEGPIKTITTEFKMIYVSVKYRTGIEGFYDAKNYGLHDMQTTITWLHQNIQHFGGDPNGLILFGRYQNAVNLDIVSTFYEMNRQGIAVVATLDGNINYQWWHSYRHQQKNETVAFLQHAENSGICSEQPDLDACLRDLSESEMADLAKNFKFTATLNPDELELDYKYVIEKFNSVDISRIEFVSEYPAYRALSDLFPDYYNVDTHGDDEISPDEVSFVLREILVGWNGNVPNPMFWKNAHAVDLILEFYMKQILVSNQPLTLDLTLQTVCQMVSDIFFWLPSIEIMHRQANPNKGSLNPVAHSEPGFLSKVGADFSVLVTEFPEEWPHWLTTDTLLHKGALDEDDLTYQLEFEILARILQLSENLHRSRNDRLALRDISRANLKGGFPFFKNLFHEFTWFDVRDGIPNYHDDKIDKNCSFYFLQGNLLDLESTTQMQQIDLDQFDWYVEYIVPLIQTEKDLGFEDDQPVTPTMGPENSTTTPESSGNALKTSSLLLGFIFTFLTLIHFE